ncbi:MULTISPECIES: carbon storage regulator CsrA [Thermoanaerobacterium]|uniref:Translational regulator CsrA n=1 Tax=Thermoanaerobacterium thermosaccharolyticum TaxID=1517 RepID=A0A223HWK4_THETR|nr:MULTISPECIES: carbon storage regulator CsrA [Thermoanaerobacterium]MDN5316904.1 carbon storage regulator [Thermoanaerobacterium sp.]AST56859.1 carbon storage regulator [Thermoanaerobacterium thermosaccharolyticum]MBE0067767.1 carbon storage regulator CsrA [Thermoanaerobacterium thermosaccharolyticum]MBE0227330.1 carbon storage regulator CsrA [Thermoanaerobacterium thermosaccharolyticum]PHO06108.1 carbon storage regulator [Thermoanaerobacterium thermosaccharolyticum]
MLILTRKIGQSLIIGDDIEVKVVGIDGENIKIGISAPKDVSVVRKELLEVKDENKKAALIDKSSLKKLEKLIKKD